jgi:hypothetical protein
MRDGEGAMEALNRSVEEGDERSIVEWRGEGRKEEGEIEEWRMEEGTVRKERMRPVHDKIPI